MAGRPDAMQSYYSAVDDAPVLGSTRDCLVTATFRF